MSISGGMGSDRFVCGVRLFCGLQSKQSLEDRAAAMGKARWNLGQSSQRGARGPGYPLEPIFVGVRSTGSGVCRAILGQESGKSPACRQPLSIRIHRALPLRVAEVLRAKSLGMSDRTDNLQAALQLQEIDKDRARKQNSGLGPVRSL
ncbi:MAG: hypothetical protein ACREXU_17280 [Gammaproteobacteria bacterium]